MNWNALLNHSLLYGAILSALSTVVILGSLRWNPEIWLNDYPPDVRAKYGPMSEKSRQQRRAVSLAYFLALLALLVISILQVGRAAGGFSFPAVFLHTFIMLMVFNLVDLLLIDWLALMVLRPSWAVLPGTKGMAGYSDYTLPLRGFLKGTLGIFIGSLVIAGITMLFTLFF